MGFVSGNYSDNLFAATLNARNSFQMVHNRAMGFNKLATMASILNFNTGGGIRIDTVNGKYEFAVDDRNEVIAQISSSVFVGLNLQINFIDSSYEFFREKDHVMDSDQNTARVIQSSPGQILIEPLGIALTSAMFASLMMCKVIGDISGIRDSHGKKTLITIPTLDYNYVSTTRDTVSLSRKDKVETLVLNGKNWWWSKAEDDMIVRIAHSDERTLLHGKRSQSTSNLEGVVNVSGGIDWSIINRGGIYIGYTSPWTEDMMQDALLTHQVRSTSTEPVTLAMGSAALMNMNRNFTKQYIQYAGSTNTFGGQSVKGLSVMMYSIGGIVYNVVILPNLNDEKFYPEMSSIPGVRGTRMSNRIYVLDLSPISVIGSAEKLPAIQRVYWGEPGPLYRVISGMVGPEGNNTGGGMIGRYQGTSNARDGYQCEYLQDQGWNIPIADRMMLIEPAR